MGNFHRQPIESMPSLGALQYMHASQAMVIRCIAEFTTVLAVTLSPAVCVMHLTFANSQQNLKHFRKDKKDFLHHLITTDEIWIYHHHRKEWCEFETPEMSSGNRPAGCSNISKNQRGTTHSLSRTTVWLPLFWWWGNRMATISFIRWGGSTKVTFAIFSLSPCKPHCKGLYQHGRTAV